MTTPGGESAGGEGFHSRAGHRSSPTYRQSHGDYRKWQEGGGTGYGLAQWTDPARKAEFAARYHHDITQSSREEQLDFISCEIRSHAEFASVLAATTAREAAKAFLTGFERPLGQGPAVQNYRSGIAANIEVKIVNQTGAAVSVSANQVR